MRKLLILLTCLLLLTPVAAQESTPLPAGTIEVSTPTLAELPVVEATEEADGDTVINITNTQPEPTPEPTPTADSDIRMNVWTIVTGVVMLLLSGVGVGFAGALVLVRSVRNNPALIAAIEGLANSRPDEQRAAANKVGGIFRETGELIEEATDGIPAAQKPALTASDVRTIAQTEILNAQRDAAG